MSRNHPCDGCARPRRRHQRLCDACFRRLPGSLRFALIDAWRRGDQRAWRAARGQVRDHLAGGDAYRSPVTPQQAAALAARITGDRD